MGIKLDEKQEALQIAKENAKKDAKQLSVKIAPIYRLLDWHWKGVPVREEEQIYGQMCKIIDQIDFRCIRFTTGGLEAELFEDGEYFIDISMRITPDYEEELDKD